MTSWREIRTQVLRRDNYQCQSCGKGTSGQVHHIIPRGKGGSHHLSNLMTLCGKCHVLVSPVPDWVIVKVWKIPLGDITSARQKVYDNIRKYQLSKVTSLAKDRCVEQGVRNNHPNAYSKWTEEDDARLASEYNQGKRVDELAKMFGRNSGAIRSRLRKLGLS